MSRVVAVVSNLAGTEWFVYSRGTDASRRGFDELHFMEQFLARWLNDTRSDDRPSQIAGPS